MSRLYNLLRRIYRFTDRHFPRIARLMIRVWRKIRKESPPPVTIQEELPAKIQNAEYIDKVFSREPSKEVDINHLSIAFVIPQPIKGSGGHRNFYRAIKYLHDFGHDLTVYYTQTCEPADNVKKNVSEWFYDMTDIPYICYDGRMGYHDVMVATWWETAYVVKKHIDKCMYPFYFVQDFEPAFSPMSSNYVLAENSYKLGFSHICSGKWCMDFLETKYGAEAEYFQFPVNTSIYNTNKPREKGNKNIIFFAKPEMARRCYEIGIMVLEIISKERPDIEIILFGSNEVNAKNLPFKATVIGLLPTLEDLADLYRNADLGIVFSTTNPSLVPFEMLSCGCPVADMDIDYAVSKYGGSNDNVFLFSPVPEEMAKGICEIIDNDSLLRYKAEKGKEWVDKSFPDELKMCRMIEGMIRNKILTGKMKL